MVDPSPTPNGQITTIVVEVAVAFADSVVVLAPTAVTVAPAGMPGPLIGMPTHIACGLATLEMMLLPDVTVPVTCAVIAANSVA